MKRLIKYWIANLLLTRMANHELSYGKEITKEMADKWNHLQGLKLSKGRIRWRWDLILKKKNQ